MNTRISGRTFAHATVKSTIFERDRFRPVVPMSNDESRPAVRPLLYANSQFHTHMHLKSKPNEMLSIE